jgi:proline iminopeptidase
LCPGPEPGFFSTHVGCSDQKAREALTRRLYHPMSDPIRKGRGSCLAAATTAIVAVVAYLMSSMGVAATGFALINERDGFVEGCGAIIYYETIGRGRPLMVLHGGPGLTHGYFLPYLLPLARHHRLIFIDERGSGRSQRLTDFSGYTMDAMVCDANKVRQALGVKVMDVLGHSFGGMLAQGYAIRYPSTVRRLVLASTWSSARQMNADFLRIENAIDPELRTRLGAMEAKGILGKDGAQLPDYRALADQVESPYNYIVRPPAWDQPGEAFGWDVLITMWGGRSDFHIDGNLAGFDFTPQLRNIEKPTLIIYGDHDLTSTGTVEEIRAGIPRSQVILLVRSGHMTFVDQADEFLSHVSEFLDD